MSMKDTENGVRTMFYVNDVRVLDTYTRFPPVVGDEVRCYGKIYRIYYRLFCYEESKYHYAYQMQEVNDADN